MSSTFDGSKFDCVMRLNQERQRINKMGAEIPQFYKVRYIQFSYSGLTNAFS